jgi:hypothetical protein
MEEHEVNQAKIKKLEAEAALLVAQVGDADVGHQIALLNAAIGAEKVKQEGRGQSINLLKDLIHMSADKTRFQSEQEHQMALAKLAKPTDKEKQEAVGSGPAAPGVQ